LIDCLRCGSHTKANIDIVLGLYKAKTKIGNWYWIMLQS